MENLGLLLDEWRVEVQKERSPAASPCSSSLPPCTTRQRSRSFAGTPTLTYPAGSFTKNLDWVNIMTYDYHGSWDTSATGAPAALYDPKSDKSTSYGLGSWIRAGVPKNKLILGLPLYGRTWKLKNPSVSGIGAPAVGLGPGDKGVLTYAEVLRFNEVNAARVVNDPTTVSAYSVAGSDWIGYDDPTSVSKKVSYARTQLGLRGYFFWAVNGDANWQVSTAASNAWSV